MFATRALSGGEAPLGLIDGNPGQVVTQLYGIVVTLVYGAVASFVLLKVTQAITGLRVSKDTERDGLDIALHGEAMP